MGYDSRASPGEKSTIPTTPESEMIMYEFANGCTGKEKYTLLLFQSSGGKKSKKIVYCTVTLRTSGTEPKIKYYTELQVNYF